MGFVEKVKKQGFIFLSPCELDDLYRRKTKQNGTISVQFKRAWFIFFLLLSLVSIECFHMTSRRPYWCLKTMKRRPYWCPKPILWEMNSFLMQMISFVPKHLHRCWPREWKKSSAIIVIIWKPLSSNCSDSSDSDHWDGTWSLSLRSLQGEWFPFDRCDRWTFFFSAIAAIIWKTGLSFFINNAYFSFFVSSLTTSVRTPGFTTSVGVPCDPVQRDWTRNSSNG